MNLANHLRRKTYKIDDQSNKVKTRVLEVKTGQTDEQVKRCETQVFRGAQVTLTPSREVKFSG